MDIANLGDLFGDNSKGNTGDGNGTSVSNDDGKPTSNDNKNPTKNSDGNNQNLVDTQTTDTIIPKGKDNIEESGTDAPAMSFDIDFGNDSNNQVNGDSVESKDGIDVTEQKISTENTGFDLNFDMKDTTTTETDNLQGESSNNSLAEDKQDNVPTFNINMDDNITKNIEEAETEVKIETEQVNQIDEGEIKDLEIQGDVTVQPLVPPVTDTEQLKNTTNIDSTSDIDLAGDSSINNIVVEENKPVQQTVAPNTIIAPEIPPLDQNNFEQKIDKPVDSFFDKKEITDGSENVKNVETNNNVSNSNISNKEAGTGNPKPTSTLDNIQKVQVSKPHIKGLKKKTSINFKAFTIGCSVFLVLIAGVITGALYYFINNPDQVNGIIGVDAIKSLLRIFSTIFFGFLFFAGFTIIVLNGYRLATIKDIPKGKFVAGLVFGLFILFGALVGGVTILQHINDLTSEDQNKPTDLILMQIPSKQGMQYLNKMPDLPLIAPMQLRYSLNPDLINKVIAEQVGTNPITNIILDCGNGKELPLGQDDLNFVGSCLYQHKGEYPMQLKFLYTDKTSNAPKEKNLTSSIYFASELFLKTSDGPYRLSDDKTEMIMGKAPVKVFFDASKVFSDLKLGTYKVSWDMDANGKFDVFDDVEFAHTYTDPKLQTVYLNIPELGKFTYSLLFRVEQSDVPICTLSGNIIKDTTYLINADCTKENGPIVGYNFFIYDANTDREIDTVNSNNSEIKYIFPTKGEYYIKLNFITDEGKKGRAESDLISVGNINFKVKYNLKYRGANDNERMLFDSTSKHIFDINKPEIVLKKLPLKLQLDVNSINPIIPGTEIFVSHMGKPILSNRKNENVFQINVQEDEKQYIDIRIYNPEIGAETKFKIPIFIEQTQIIGSLRAFPDTVGETPFLVKLNASSTKVTDDEDKIVYFSRDFDDGEKNKDTSQGIVEHVYTYNDLKENGEYHPKVTIKTAKGLSKVIELDKPIMVKKPRLKAMIMIDSHPGQIANKDDVVHFSIRTDGQPEKIIRDFGDGETVEMEGRAATEQEHVYNVPGEYKIKASIVYDNKTTSYPNINLVVDE